MQDKTITINEVKNATDKQTELQKDKDLMDKNKKTSCGSASTETVPVMTI